MKINWIKNNSPKDNKYSIVSIFASVFILAFIAITIVIAVYGGLGFNEAIDEKILTVTETTTKGIKTIISYKSEPRKTLWDWLVLAGVPFTIAVLGFSFQYSQEKAKAAKADQDRKRDEDQHREAALQDYLSFLSDLLVDKQLRNLLPKIPDFRHEISEVDILKVEPEIDANAALDVIQARTLSLLRLFREDTPRKASVLSFLGDADLLRQLNLDLSQFCLENANLSGANLTRANLGRANLSGANLSYANLSRANLVRANLSGANLNNAHLSFDPLHPDPIFGANLKNAELSKAELKNANLRNANLPKANLSGADLSNAELIGANFSGADLSGADLTGAELSCATFTDANLNGAILTHTKFKFEQIRSAINWETAKFDGKSLHDPEVKKQLGLDAETQ
jgi:uncharacterized protein YjbI with pentapeptide repeats